MSVPARAEALTVRSAADVAVRLGALGASGACVALAILMGGLGVGPFLDLPSVLLVALPTVGMTVAAFGVREPVQAVAFLVAGQPTQAQLSRGAGIAFSVGAFALGSGMLGSLIGMVQLLQNMSDPTAIGPGMAVALLSTLYAIGTALVAFVAALRLAERSGRAEAIGASGGVGMLAMTVAGLVFYAPVVAMSFLVLLAAMLVF